MAGEKTKAEFSMGAKDYERFDKILEKMADVQYSFFQGDIQSIKPFYSITKVFYKAFRAAIKGADKEKLDKRFKALRRIQSGNVIPSDFETLEYLSDDVMELRQKMGMGIVIVKEISQRQKIRAPLGLS